MKDWIGCEWAGVDSWAVVGLGDDLLLRGFVRLLSRGLRGDEQGEDDDGNDHGGEWGLLLKADSPGKGDHRAG